MIMSNLINMEFVQALNPLYAFPIIAVIVCAFIVYAFGFKSPVQPPSFDGFEEEKKVVKKRKQKDSNKQSKVVQNGKLNGTTSKQAQASPSNKKEKSASTKPIEDKTVGERKATKKGKHANEKKILQEKKKDNFSPALEENGEDGWVQLISKKGRKNRKKDEVVSTESQTGTKALKDSLTDKYGETIVSETSIKPVAVKESIVEEKVVAKIDTVSIVEKRVDKVIVIETESALYETSSSKPPSIDVVKGEKLNEETSSKSKKKKKKNTEDLSKDKNCIVTPFETPAVQVVPEILPAENVTIITDTPEATKEQEQDNEKTESKLSDIISGKLEGQDQDNEKTEPRSSNVVFDELEGLYPKEEKPRKKKKVRRDH